MSYVYAGYSIVLATLAVYALAIWRSHRRVLADARALGEYPQTVESAQVTRDGSLHAPSGNTETRNAT